MPRAEQGRIIHARILDSEGGNPKRRPAVIVTATEEIQPGKPFVVAGITTKLHLAPRNEQVELPWLPNGRRHPVTLLTERCVAVSTWLEEVCPEDIEEFAGVVPTPKLRELLRLIYEDEGGGG